MAGSNGRSGQGITIAFATSGFSASIHFIGGTERERGKLETSDLSLPSGSERTYIPADLVDVKEFVVRFEWNQSFSTFPPLTADAETITITFPLRSGESTNATLAGTGFCIRDKGPDVEINDDGVMEGEITVTWDGATGPTYTAGS